MQNPHSFSPVSIIILKFIIDSNSIFRHTKRR